MVKKEKIARRVGVRGDYLREAINRGTDGYFSRKYSSLILRVGGNFLLLAEHNKLL